jgi:hypothetical protein
VLSLLIFFEDSHVPVVIRAYWIHDEGLEDMLWTQVDRNIFATLDFLVVAAKDERVLGGNINAELVPV